MRIAAVSGLVLALIAACTSDEIDINDLPQLAAEAFLEPLGIVGARKLNSVEFHDSLEDMPAGEYAFVTFDTSLADDGSTSEWRVS